MFLNNCKFERNCDRNVLGSSQGDAVMKLVSNTWTTTRQIATMTGHPARGHFGDTTNETQETRSPDPHSSCVDLRADQ